jgi:uncharacterized protein (UPF0210 family)
MTRKTVSERLKEKVAAKLQKAMVERNQGSRFLVRGYHSGDFMGRTTVVGLTGAWFVVDRSFSPTVKVGEKIWVPYANYVEMMIDKTKTEEGGI